MKNQPSLLHKSAAYITSGRPSPPVPDKRVKRPHCLESAPLIQLNCLGIRRGDSQTDPLRPMRAQRIDGLPQQLIPEPSTLTPRRNAKLRHVPDLITHETHQHQPRHPPRLPVEGHKRRRLEKRPAAGELDDVVNEPARAGYRPVLVVDLAIDMAVVSERNHAGRQ